MDKLSIDYMQLGIVFALIILDIVTGLIKAWLAGDITSHKMREGLIHKATYLIMIIVGCMCEVAMKHYDMGIQLPTAYGICSIIALTEIVSIAENLVATNPEISKWPVFKQLANADKNVVKSD